MDNKPSVYMPQVCITVVLWDSCPCTQRCLKRIQKTQVIKLKGQCRGRTPPFVLMIKKASELPKTAQAVAVALGCPTEVNAYC